MKKTLCVWAALCIVPAYAAELGSVLLHSHTGQTLQAEIPLTLEEQDSFEAFSVSVIEVKPNIPGFTATLLEEPDAHIALTSAGPLKETAFSVTLALKSAAGIDEYHYEVTPQGLPRAPKAITYGPIRSGDTLWKVAQTLAQKHHLGVEATMDSLYQNNPKAFLKGADKQLIAGAYLKLPQRKATPSTSVQAFKPTEVITQTAVEPVAPQLAEQAPTFPEFPEMSAGEQVAIATPSLKLTHSFSDVAPLFTSPVQAPAAASLSSIANAQETALIKMVEKLQQELLLTRDAMDVERRTKEALQAQVRNLEVQMRALAELVTLKQSVTQVAVAAEPEKISLWLQRLNGGDQKMALILIAIGLASFIMYVWDLLSPKVRVANAESKSGSQEPIINMPQPAILHEVAHVDSAEHFYSIDRLIAQGRYERAQTLLHEILQHSPGNYEALYRLCQIDVKTGNQSAYEERLSRITARWRAKYVDKYQKLKSLYETAWPIMEYAYETDSGPFYEGDPPSDPVQTKLDLARAYIDIGDQESAVEILKEVLREGTPQQIMIARALISQIELS